MIDLLPPPSLLLPFIAAALVLAVVPGPGVLYIVARALTQGRASGLASVAGVACGNLANAVAASLGLAVVLSASTLWFSVLTYAGAAYLFYLGWQALRATGTPTGDDPRPAVGLGRVFGQGVWVALLNPKTALFFAAFLPPFISPAGSAMGQGVALSVVFVGIAALSDSVYALAAAVIAPRLRANPALAARGRYASAAIYIGLGVYAALSGGRLLLK